MHNNTHVYGVGHNHKHVYRRGKAHGAKHAFRKQKKHVAPNNQLNSITFNPLYHAISECSAYSVLYKIQWIRITVHFIRISFHFACVHITAFSSLHCMFNLFFVKCYYYFVCLLVIETIHVCTHIYRNTPSVRCGVANEYSLTNNRPFDRRKYEKIMEMKEKKTNTTNRNQFLIQFERVVCEMRVCGRMQAIECECKCELSARVCPSLSCMQRCVQCKCIGLVAFVFVCAFMLVLHYKFEIYWSLACCYCNGIVTASCIHTHMYVVHFLH